MNKEGILLVFSLAAFNLVFSQGYNGDSWAQAKAKGEGEILLAYVESPGMVYKDNSGKLTGICVDIMSDFVKYVNQKKNVKLSTKFVGDGGSFKAMYDNVKASKNGVIGLGNVTITEERKKELKFGPPFFTNLTFLLSQNTIPTLAKLEDIKTAFAGLTSYTAKGTLSEKKTIDLKQKYFPDMKIVYTASSQETYEKVIADPKGFAYLELAYYLESVQQRKPLKRHSVGDKASDKFGFILPLNSDWQPVLEEFFKADGGYTNSPAYKTILSKHLGEIGLKLLQGAGK
ncbi:MAG: transporter substrate-binding domain-containing protein [Bacteroidetes bacterium]|nr:transporter substrate-binding domain-containing protein [Bacteroidota bacterium]